MIGPSSCLRTLLLDRQMESQWFLKCKKMVHKWCLCIEVSCFPNPGRAVIKFVLYNMATNHLFHGKREVPGMTTNNEAYYIALVERLKEAKQHDVNDIEVFTNSELICNQI